MRKILIAACCTIIWNLAIAKPGVDVDTASGLQFRLSAFFGKCLDNNNVEINFTIAETFTTVSHFAIYRSFNNLDFESVGIVTQTDNSPTSHSYTFNDKLPFQNIPETIYYKLKQVNNNRTTTESYIITVKIKKSNSSQLKTWPNPVIQNLQIQCKNANTGTVEIQILNNLGVVLQQGNVVLKKGDDSFDWTNTAKLQTGIYIIVLKQNNKIINQSIFIKS